MQGNGFKIGVIVAFLALTLYYLYPTIIWNLEQKQMAELSYTELAEYKSENMEKHKCHLCSSISSFSIIMIILFILA